MKRVLPGSIFDIVDACAKTWCISPKAILGSTRFMNVIEARYTAIACVRATSRLSLTQIGFYFNRDHTTVIHALLALRKMCEEDSDLKAIIRIHHPIAFEGMATAEASARVLGRREANRIRRELVQERMGAA